jgi:hypothetical protein
MCVAGKKDVELREVLLEVGVPGREHLQLRNSWLETHLRQT